MRLSFILSFLILFSNAAVSLNAEPRRSDTISLREPLDIPLLLSGNFGELRRNHFHSGVDFKTQGKTGLPVLAADDGYVSRASVSPWGFGRAVYVTHPATGLTTVYGHLEAFAPKIDAKVRNEQYNRETFSIDMEFEPGDIPVKRGETIGRSGNAGSSGGPHLHFDVRDTALEDPLDPLEYFRKSIKDNVAPEVRQLALYPVNGGVVDGTSTKGSYRSPQEKAEFKAWGQIIPGIKAYDRMSGTANIYGVKYLSLTVDGDTVYSRVVDHFSFDDTRAIHTIVNNEDLMAYGAWIMTTRVADSRPLSYMITAKNKGIVDIDEERPYNFTWLLEDEHGNKTSRNFIVTGEKRISDSPMAQGDLMLWNADNIITGQGAEVYIPQGALYDNIFLEIAKEKATGYESDIFSIGNKAVPLAKAYTLTIPLVTDSIADKSKYCLVMLNGTKRVAKPSTYSDGKLTANLTEFGRYAVTTDNKIPVIQPLTKDRWRSTGMVKFKITDDLSGVEKWRGEIDGRFALFEFDGKTATLSFKIDKERFPGNSHDVSLTVTDACGNETRWQGRF